MQVKVQVNPEQRVAENILFMPCTHRRNYPLVSVVQYQESIGTTLSQDFAAGKAVGVRLSYTVQ